MPPGNSTCDAWLRGLEDSMTTALGARGKLELADTGRSSAWGQMRGVIQAEGSCGGQGASSWRLLRLSQSLMGQTEG